MTANQLTSIVNKILNPLKGKISNRDHKYLEIRMLEIGAAKVK